MKCKTTILALTALLFTFTLAAQNNIGWQWAKRGGGPVPIDGYYNAVLVSDFERIVDMTVDGQGHYYFLAQITGLNVGDMTNYEGMDVQNYNAAQDYTDIYVFSTDSNGNFRWDKVIGGGFTDYGASINVDGQGNVYISGTAPNSYPPLPFILTPTQ